MAGGTLNIVSHGPANVIIHGNPDVTMFKHKYKKHTNFGLQRLELNFQGQRRLQTSTDTLLEFDVPRYGDLLWDTYLVVTLPDIYSSVYWNAERTNTADTPGAFIPYEFRWVDELGTTMIHEVEVTIGSATMARYSGEQLSILNHRDNTAPRQELWNRMTGNVNELKNPAYANGRQGVYPTATYLEDPSTSQSLQPEPSIRGRDLIIPLEPWFGLTSSTAFPLVAIQNQDMKIRVRLRSVDELFRVRNVLDASYACSYIAPNQNVPEFQIQRFLYPPTDISGTEYNGIFIGSPEFSKMPDSWNANIHLLATYVFLEDKERTWFAKHSHKYLVRDVFEHDIHHVQGSKQLDIDARDAVSHFMFRFRRSDVKERNEWSNYTNWPYKELPYQPSYQNPYVSSDLTNQYVYDASYQLTLTERMQSMSPWEFTANTLQSKRLATQYPMTIAGSANQRDILMDMAIIMDGKYRENVLQVGVYRDIEAYSRGNRLGGNVKEGVYLYSFATSMNRHDLHPSGAMNLNHFKRVQFEINTINPPLNPNAPYENICDTDIEGNTILIGVRRNMWEQYMYGYDVRIFEERYNVMEIKGGMAGFMFAR